MAAIPRFATVKGHELTSRILCIARLIEMFTITGKKIVTITFALAGFPVSPIRWVIKLRQKYISGAARKLLNAIHGLIRKPVTGIKYI